MYLNDYTSPYNGLSQYNIFNPPDYWTTMIDDPTQPPVQIYPYGYGYGSGGGGGHPYGPYPGFYVGQRPMTYEDAERQARERARAMVMRAEVSEDPSHKYLTEKGRLAPKIAAALKAAEAESKRRKGPDLISKLQKRILLTVLLGSVLSALLR